MAKRSTPIERAIAGEPSDRRKRYVDRMHQKGFKRLTVHVRPEDKPLVSRIAELSRTMPPAEFDALMTKLLNAARGGPERTERSEGAPRRRPAREAHG